MRSFHRILYSCAFCFSYTPSVYISWYQSLMISSYYLLCAIIPCYFVCRELLNNHGWKRSQSKHVQEKKKRDSSREINVQELMIEDTHRQIMELKRRVRVIKRHAGTYLEINLSINGGEEPEGS